LFVAILTLCLVYADEEAAKTKSVLVEVAETDKIAAQLGKWANVRGKVERTGKSKANTQFFNFSNNKFVVVCFADALKLFDKGEPADLYNNKRVEISGMIEQYKTQYQIKLCMPDQVKIIQEEPTEDVSENSKVVQAARYV
tara:strand:+ start:290 stop:712 length:423 start_codon:yes stop_codon:yes gene_type:complete